MKSEARIGLAWIFQLASLTIRSTLPSEYVSFKLCQQGRDLAEELEAAVADMAAVPAVAQEGGQGVVALLEQRGHVVDLVADPLAIIGPVGGKHVVADALAVDAQLVKPQRRCIQPGRSHRLAPA